MNRRQFKIGLIVLLIGWIDVALARQTSSEWKPDWLAVSNPEELRRTWSSALVYLPAFVGGNSGRLFQNEASQTAQLLAALKGKTLPVLVFLHACEGLGHHRDDLRNFAKLGFVVIAPDSFAREHRPLGCYEEREVYIKYYDIAVAFQKAELDYAVKQLDLLPWVHQKHRYLMGSGTGGMVVAHYQGSDFSRHVIEGWGCHHPHAVFSGIWSPIQIPVFSVVSKNDPWYTQDSGFEIDCARYIEQRPQSVAIELDRPAHYVSWYPGSRTSLIKFLTQDLGVPQEPLIDDTPRVLHSTAETIVLERKWSIDAVYQAARNYCSTKGKKSHLSQQDDIASYTFICD